MRYRVFVVGERSNQVLQAISFVAISVLAVPLIAKNLGHLADVLQVALSGAPAGDFVAFYGAGQLYNSHAASPYDLHLLREAELRAAPMLADLPQWADENTSNPFRNPPFYLPVVGYLANFSMPLAFVISALIETMALGMLLAITSRMATLQALPVAAITWIAVCLAGRNVWQGLEYAQLPSYLVGLSFTLGLLLLLSGRVFWAGFVFSLMAIKFLYLPLLVFFLLIFPQWRKAFLGLLSGGFLLLAASLAVVGPDGMLLYIKNLWELFASPVDNYFSAYEHMYSWRALLQLLPGANAPSLAIVRAMLPFLMWGLAAWWLWWTTRDLSTAWRRSAAFLLLTLAMIFASPHSHGQDMVLLLPGLALMMSHLWNAKLPSAVTFMSASGLLLFFWLLNYRPLGYMSNGALVLLNAPLIAALLAALGLILRFGGEARNAKIVAALRSPAMVAAEVTMFGVLAVLVALWGNNIH